MVTERAVDSPKAEVNNCLFARDDTLLGSDPAQLAVGYQVAPCLAPVGGQLVQVLADYQGSEKADGGADNLVSTANGEGLSRSQLVLSLLRANRNTKGLMRTMP